jgi:hypothetical protein
MALTEFIERPFRLTPPEGAASHILNGEAWGFLSQ